MTKIFFLVLCLWAAIGSVSAAPAALRVACVGDSITYGVNLPPDQTYPADLQKALGLRAVVQTFAFPGLSLLSLPTGNPALHPAYVGTSYYRQALRFNPNIVIIMLGTNDGSFPLRPGQSWTGVYGQRFTAQVFVATCPTVFGINQYAIDPAIVNNTVVPYLVQIGIAVHAPIIDIHRATAPYSADFGDKVHPSPHGAFVIAQAVSASLKPALKTRR